MTRGTGYIITDRKIYDHDEFNGDMYRENGNGESFIRMLDKTTPSNFKSDLHLWNVQNHNYDTFQTYSKSLKGFTPIRITEDGTILDFTKNYFDWWFSDWIFIKNMSKRSITAVCEDGAIALPKNHTYAFHFGNIEDGYRVSDGSIIQFVNKELVD